MIYIFDICICLYTHTHTHAHTLLLSGLGNRAFIFCLHCIHCSIYTYVCMYIYMYVYIYIYMYSTYLSTSGEPPRYARVSFTETEAKGVDAVRCVRYNT